MLVQPGELGVDFSYTKTPPAVVLAHGYTFIVGYLTEPPSSVGKRLLNPLDYVNAGLGVLLVWEQSATEANKGYDEGRRDGADARRDATLLGYPTYLPILAACDTNTTAANAQAQVQYMIGFAETCGVMGIYGDVDILRATSGLWAIGWLPNAWSWSNPIARLPGETDAQYSARGRAGAVANGRAAGVHVYQSTGLHLDGLYPVDPNRADLAFPAWGREGEEEVATMIFTVQDLPGEYMWSPGSNPIAFATPEDRDAVRVGLGVGGTQHLSFEQYSRLFVPPVQVTVPPITIPPIVVPPIPAPVVRFPNYTITATASPA